MATEGIYLPNFVRISNEHRHLTAKQSASCQCTMCRKWTSSLFPQFLTLSAKQITPDLSTYPSYKEYRSSEACLRGFCNQCGSSLLWRTEENPDQIDVFLGTVDEKWLVEQKADIATATGQTESESIGKTLGTPMHAQYYYENVIKGVTDFVQGGKRYLTHPSKCEGF